MLQLPAAKLAHIRQSRPDFDLGFQIKLLETFSGVASSLGNGKATIAQGIGHALEPRRFLGGLKRKTIPFICVDVVYFVIYDSG